MWAALAPPTIALARRDDGATTPAARRPQTTAHGMLAARTLLRSRNARWQLRSLHSQRTTVGLVGAGNMGRGMAASLARAGLPVAQFDRDAAALAASAAASPLIEAVGR